MLLFYYNVNLCIFFISSFATINQYNLLQRCKQCHYQLDHQRSEKSSKIMSCELKWPVCSSSYAVHFISSPYLVLLGLHLSTEKSSITDFSCFLNKFPYRICSKIRSGKFTKKFHICYWGFSCGIAVGFLPPNPKGNPQPINPVLMYPSE